MTADMALHRSLLVTRLAVLAAVTVAALPVPARSQSPCPGAAPLIVVEQVQNGFAGRTGERTSLGEDGCYSVEAVFDGSAGHLRSGLLGADRVAAVRAAVAAADLASLPDKAGAAHVVNPMTVSVTCAGVTRTVTAPGGTAIADMTAIGNGALARLAAVVLALTAPPPAP